jgi:hypothetical protein
MKTNLPIFIIFSVISLLILIFGIQECTEKKLNTAVLSTSNSELVQTIIDSVKNEQSKLEIAKFDSINYRN